MKKFAQAVNQSPAKKKSMTIIDFFHKGEENVPSTFFYLFCGDTFSIKDFVSQACVKSLAVVCGHKTIVLPKLDNENGAMKPIFQYPGAMQKLIDAFVPTEEGKAEWNLFVEYFREKTQMQVMHQYMYLSCCYTKLHSIIWFLVQVIRFFSPSVVCPNNLYNFLCIFVCSIAGSSARLILPVA